MQDTPPEATPSEAAPDSQDISKLVAPPAIAMIVLTCLSLLLRLVELVFEPMARMVGWIIHETNVHYRPESDGGWWIFEVSRNIFGFAISGVVLLGGLMMLQQRSWALSLAAAILMSVPCIGPCCPIGIPVGIWALVILLKPEVRQALERNG